MSALRTLTVPVAVTALLGASSGCGSSGSGSDATSSSSSKSSVSTVDSAFSARADAARQQYADYTSTAYLRLPHFNRYAPAPGLLPKVATYLEQNPAYQGLVADLEALGVPASGADAWARVLDDFRATAADVEDEIAGARSKDAQRFSDLTSQLEQDMTTLYADLAAAGVDGTSCAKAEDDPLKPPPANEG